MPKPSTFYEPKDEVNGWKIHPVLKQFSSHLEIMHACVDATRLLSAWSWRLSLSSHAVNMRRQRMRPSLCKMFELHIYGNLHWWSWIALHDVLDKNMELNDLLVWLEKLSFTNLNGFQGENGLLVFSVK